MRMIVFLALALVVASPANAVTLFNSQDPKIEPATSKAAEQLNRAFSEMYEVLALVESRSLKAAEEAKGEAVRRFQEAAKSFAQVAKQASNQKIVPSARDAEDNQVIQTMSELAKVNKFAINDYGEFSEQSLFFQLSSMIDGLAKEFRDLSPAAFTRELRDKRQASEFLLHAIRLQNLGRLTTAYLAIPRNP